MAYSFNSSPQSKQFYSVYLRQNVANSNDDSAPLILPPLPRTAYELTAQTKGFSNEVVLDSDDDGTGIDAYNRKYVISFDSVITDVNMSTQSFGSFLEGQVIQINCSDTNVTNISIQNCNNDSTGYFSYTTPVLYCDSYEVNIVGYFNGTYWEFYVANEIIIDGVNTNQYGSFKIGAIKSDMTLSVDKDSEERDTEGNLITLSEKISCSITDMNCTKDNYEALRLLEGELDILTISTSDDKGSCIINTPTYSYMGVSSADGFLTKINAERICRDSDDFLVTY